MPQLKQSSTKVGKGKIAAVIKENHYDAVAHLIPDDTDVMSTILRAMARYEVLSDPFFRDYLSSLRA